ncbi:GNAT family N-acetyltransferase [Nocardioides perillae]|uniref:GNAT superfamily N-acetyltransferase n=1 Tax=Nocardioides perillae TaxID=1119534 RepID=A0A7Y9RYL5_9ACTN|nr:GNAT family N-acetyltransferase [Nocardioides perillae]NYG56330.1 GNAT superfamily N-acetyltransferase [Nocardioides perillae]
MARPDGPTADVSVRVAWADDAAAVAAVQVRAWARDLAGRVAADDLPDAESVAAAWHRSLTASGDARNRVLVALERARVVGFAVTVPAADPDCDPVADGELAELVVAPDETGRGHGSRLLQAAADTLAADRFTRAVHWVAADDDARRAFLQGAGWAPDTAHRELDLGAAGGATLRQVRLHTALGDPAA